MRYIIPFVAGEAVAIPIVVLLKLDTSIAIVVGFLFVGAACYVTERFF